MAFTIPGKGSTKAEINVTPMIDVLLVLLIIFMVIAPERSVGLDALVPQPSSNADRSQAGEVVITVHDGGAIDLNREFIASSEVAARLNELFLQRREVVVFVRADEGLTFEPVAQVIDIAKGAGLKRVALMRR